ncbi:hypothetical protein MOO44_03975 [Nicoliella spurrieriana]|uniref:Uncharacterized protein n=1 Tax=Nicoliella spurrieriana TaxID=2925830 RepID=A0A976RT53_9LACO|nr:hypothetical protein [Nicoliella spurrieriana]UQS87323.1 hypothetical protein MOO44_03975 [Nicoliella spurrieriana]
MKIKDQLYINPLENVQSDEISKLRSEQSDSNLLKIAHVAAVREVHLNDYHSEMDLHKMTVPQKAEQQSQIVNRFFAEQPVTINRVRRNATLTNYLRDWYGRDLGMTDQESALSMAKQVHGFLDSGADWYYLSQVNNGEHAFDADLLGGTGDGSFMDYFTTYYTQGDKYMNEATADGRDEEWVRMIFTQRIKNATAFLKPDRLIEIADQFKDDMEIYNAIISNQN